MRTLIYLIICLGVLQITSCIKPTNNDPNASFTNSLPSEYKNLYYFKKGSYWIYKNSCSDGTIRYDTFYVKDSKFDKRYSFEEKVGQEIFTEFGTPYIEADTTVSRFRFYTYFISIKNQLKVGAMPPNDTPFSFTFGLYGYGRRPSGLDYIEKYEGAYFYGTNNGKNNIYNATDNKDDSCIYRKSIIINGKQYDDVLQISSKEYIKNKSQAYLDSFSTIFCPKVGMLKFGFVVYGGQSTRCTTYPNLTLVKYYIEP